MNWLKTIISELYSLFVDDASFAIAIVIWLAITSLIGTYLTIPPLTKGPILFAGLAIILAESAYRRSRK